MSLLFVFYQDVKERLVYWFLFPVIAICSGILLYNNMFYEAIKTTLIINFAFVLFLVLVVLGYSKFKLNTSISQTFGLGDTLLFFALAFTFSSISFLVLFVFGLIFSLTLHLLIKRRSVEHKTVPLAGYLSLFFAIAYVSHWTGILKSVYSI
ncbi:hypothetical protein [Winogradskyella sp.]|uniref:hypothetical protein n=1 Tax=Winogradskyella sp. TaxID=1883156 RepID=UPI0026122C2E|nr:hypothetical protein [Winogradskyella sp.]